MFRVMESDHPFNEIHFIWPTDELQSYHSQRVLFWSFCFNLHRSFYIPVLIKVNLQILLTGISPWFFNFNHFQDIIDHRWQ